MPICVELSRILCTKRAWCTQTSAQPLETLRDPSFFLLWVPRQCKSYLGWALSWAQSSHLNDWPAYLLHGIRRTEIRAGYSFSILFITNLHLILQLSSRLISHIIFIFILWICARIYYIFPVLRYWIQKFSNTCWE